MPIPTEPIGSTPRLRLPAARETAFEKIRARVPETALAARVLGI